MKANTERPIIFTGESVRAILAGRKTQTRRVFKGVSADTDHFAPNHDGKWVQMYKAVPRAGCGASFHAKAWSDRCPYGAPGDRLWVRETWAGGITKSRDSVDYKADGHTYGTDEDGETLIRWRSPLFMPRWASRITLELTNVRVQRVQEISEQDAMDEGFYQAVRESPDGIGQDVIGWYATLWDQINSKRGFPWSANPWAWALTFKVVEPMPAKEAA